MQAAFEQAWETRPSKRSEVFCGFAGRPARIRIVGSGLAERVMPAFEHLLVKERPTSFQLKIDLWEEFETSIPCPVDPAPVENRLLQSTPYVEYGLILTGRDDRFVGCQRPQVMTWLDRASRHVIGHIFRHDLLPLYDRGKPLHLPLLLWHGEQGVDVIHAALVSREGRGVLFAGKGGLGKSTSALACVESDFDYLGDDYIGLQRLNDGSFVGYSIYGSTWLMAHHLRRFPGLIPHALYPEHPEQEKTLVPLARVFPGRLVPRAQIRAVVLPRITGASTTRLRQASKGEALFALAPSSMLLLPNSGASALGKLASLAEQVPCYWLELGRNLEEISGRIEEIIGSSRLRQAN